MTAPLVSQSCYKGHPCCANTSTVTPFLLNFSNMHNLITNWMKLEKYFNIPGITISGKRRSFDDIISRHVDCFINEILLVEQ